MFSTCGVFSLERKQDKEKLDAEHVLVQNSFRFPFGPPIGQESKKREATL